MAPTVSLIITSYNRSVYLAAAIESVLKQTYTDFELLLWDDGSTDLSPHIARYYALQDSRIRVKTAPHQGVAPTLKAAIAATTGQYLGWVDSDDLLAPIALEQTVAVLNTYPHVGMVYTNYRVIDAQGRDRGLGKRCHIPYSPDKLLVNFMTFHFRLIRRSLYEQVGGIDSSFTYAIDYDLCLKLSEVTDIYHLPQALYAYRTHAHSISTQYRSEQDTCARRAIENALIRRGMNCKADRSSNPALQTGDFRDN
ncbi:glycosyltransferase [Egbenema bharatensis]|uniref:glycosyltransferase n=1 Tax=Egbenema bharatensis TaxID=3463334 RepID=UPI003A893EA8